MARRYKLVSDDALKALSGLVGLVRLRLKGRSARKHSKKTSAPLGRRLPQIGRDHSPVGAYAGERISKTICEEEPSNHASSRHRSGYRYYTYCITMLVTQCQ